MSTVEEEREEIVLTLRPTGDLVEINGAPCRVWKGQTDHGVALVAFVACLAIDRRDHAENERFARVLRERQTPLAEVLTDERETLLELMLRHTGGAS
jgi:hypothetical protein